MSGFNPTHGREREEYRQAVEGFYAFVDEAPRALSAVNPRRLELLARLEVAEQAFSAPLEDIEEVTDDLERLRAAERLPEDERLQAAYRTGDRWIEEEHEAYVHVADGYARALRELDLEHPARDAFRSRLREAMQAAGLSR